MRFEVPTPFEIPDAVWAAAGAHGWRPAGPCYAATAYHTPGGRAVDDLAVECVPLAQIIPPVRTGGSPWFVDDRLRRSMQGMVNDDTLPAVLGQRRDDDPTALVQLVDGMHRFYASAALGFTHVPVAVRPWFEM